VNNIYGVESQQNINNLNELQSIDLKEKIGENSDENYKSEYSKLPLLNIHRRTIPAVKYMQNEIDKSYEIELVAPSNTTPGLINMVDYSN
jgi:hypothetical protein